MCSCGMGPIFSLVHADVSDVVVAPWLKGMIILLWFHTYAYVFCVCPGGLCILGADCPLQCWRRIAGCVSLEGHLSDSIFACAIFLLR